MALKQGNREVMTLFGFGTPDTISVLNFEILTPKVSIGKTLDFSFQLQQNANQKEILRIEYGIYYLKANGTHSRKVFKTLSSETFSD